MGCVGGDPCNRDWTTGVARLGAVTGVAGKTVVVAALASVLGERETVVDVELIAKLGTRSQDNVRLVLFRKMKGFEQLLC